MIEVDKENMLTLALKAVRDSGKTNMWQSNSVQYYAFHMGFFEFVNWYEEADKGDYSTLLISTDYEKVASVNTKKLLNLEDASLAREYVVKHFSEQIKNYEPFTLKQISLTKDEVLKQSKTAIEYINEFYSDHAMNYIFKSPNSSRDIYWFKDGVYESVSSGYEKISTDTWEKITKGKDNLNEENKAKYEVLNKLLRLRVVLS